MQTSAKSIFQFFARLHFLTQIFAILAIAEKRARNESVVLFSDAHCYFYCFFENRI